MSLAMGGEVIIPIILGGIAVAWLWGSQSAVRWACRWQHGWVWCVLAAVVAGAGGVAAGYAACQFLVAFVPWYRFSGAVAADLPGILLANYVGVVVLLGVMTHRAAPRTRELFVSAGVVWLGSAFLCAILCGFIIGRSGGPYCVRELNRIHDVGKGLLLYHAMEEQYPTDLRRLVEEGYVGPKYLLRCGVDRDPAEWEAVDAWQEGQSYTGPVEISYLPETLRTENPPGWLVVAWFPPRRDEEGGTAILRADFYAEFIPTRQLSEEVRKTVDWLEAHRSPTSAPSSQQGS